MTLCSQAAVYAPRAFKHYKLTAKDMRYTVYKYSVLWVGYESV